MGEQDDLICFSQQRWGQPAGRTHQLMACAARDRRVFFVEEPVFGGQRPELQIEAQPHGVIVVRPTLPAGTDNLLVSYRLRDLMRALLHDQQIVRYALWFSTPMAMAFARDLTPVAVVYDHGSDLAETDEAVAGLAAYHTQLLASADVIAGEEPSGSWDETWTTIGEQLAAASLPPVGADVGDAIAV
jgi:UDP-galactopyranose mutase